MNSYLAAALMIFSAFLAALSQMLLKKSADRTHKNVLMAYLNPRVITAYGILFLTMMLNVVAYRDLPYKVGATLSATSYVFVMLLGRISLGERITMKKAIGNLLIIVGIVVFNWK